MKNERFAVYIVRIIQPDDTDNDNFCEHQQNNLEDEIRQWAGITHVAAFEATDFTDEFTKRMLDKLGLSDA